MIKSQSLRSTFTRLGRSRWQRRELIIGLLFISPAIVGFFAFTVYPILQSLYYSFTDYNILQSPLWVGFENYSQIFHDRVFITALTNTFYMVVVGLPLHLVVDFAIALLLSTRIRGLSIFRTIFYLPSITPIVATAILWAWLLNSQYGPLNTVLIRLGLPTIGFLTDPVWTKPSVILMGLWYGGNTILIYLAALQEVPAELLEAAELDGSGSLNKLWHVVIPMVSPVIFFTLVLNLIGYFQIFTEGWVLTATRDGSAGGPLNSLLFYSMYLYQNAFHFFKMGLASAQAWILFLIILLATLFVFRTSGWVYYRSED